MLFIIIYNIILKKHEKIEKNSKSRIMVINYTVFAALCFIYD